MNWRILVAVAMLVAGCAPAGITGTQEGLVEYLGSQNRIMETGKADPVLSLLDLQGGPGLYAVGPVKDLDGEITVFDSVPRISTVRGAGYSVETSWNHDAIFMVWTRQSEWRDIPVPGSVVGYTDLQDFVKAQAIAAGLDVAKPFPFLLAGSPGEIKWHINVDRTDGKPVTAELFAKSKASYVVKGEAADIIGFYSERHPGVFISKLAPAIPAGSGRANANHIHFVSKASDATGHIDDIKLGQGMVLRLPMARRDG